MRRTLALFAEPVIFDRGLKAIQRSAAAHAPDSSEYDYLRDEVATRLVDRLNDITRELPVALDLGCGAGHIAKKLTGHGGIKTLYGCDMSEGMLWRDSDTFADLEVDYKTVVVDEEDGLPFEDDTFDVVMSSMSLQWVNDLPRCLAHVRRVLKPDGVFLAAFPGGDTLGELRSAFVAAETERDGGVSPRLSPTVALSDGAALLTAAGFAIPTVDADTIEVEYEDAFHLMEHLQGMGESNATIKRRRTTSRDLMLAAGAAYQAMHGGPDGGIRATFQIVYLIGWAPHHSQPKPIARGSHEVSLKDI